ncbi:MAG: hypothetical protein GY822_13635 [Deltaproteobacteria bacterium]|nr:hypothetical protein [Deltaproteobacteria bacterium]
MLLSKMARKTSYQVAPLLLAVGMLVLGLAVFADGPPGPSLLLPYQGRIENNGVPQEEVLDITFSLFETAEGGDPPLWTSTRTVDPDSGAFGVVLGEVETLPNTLRTLGSVYLEISIGTKTFGPRSLLHPAFQAVTSNGAVEADHAMYADGNDTGTFAIAKKDDEHLSKITFAQHVAGNDPGSIVHHEDNNTGLLWLSSSDDWGGVGQAEDKIIFGDQGSGTERFSVNAKGTGKFAANLEVAGSLVVQNDIEFGSLSGFNISRLYEASKHNESGAQNVIMTQVSTSICWLTRIDVGDADTVEERTGCRINITEGFWQLQAFVTGSSTDADAWCAARCLSWD